MSTFPDDRRFPNSMILAWFLPPRKRRNAFAFAILALLTEFAARVSASQIDTTSRCIAASSGQNWSHAEHYVGREMCAGHVADLRRFERDRDRDLSRAFLETALFRSQFATLIEDSGLRISGAHIRRSIKLDANKVTFPVWLDDSIFDGDLVIEDLNSTAAVTLDNSTVRGTLDLSGLTSPASDVELQGWAQSYFFIHRIAGFVLASFLIASLSGLTK